MFFQNQLCNISVSFFRLPLSALIVAQQSPTCSPVKSATENKGPEKGELFPINIKCLGIQENRVNEKPLELRSSQVTISIISLILTSSAISTSFTISIISLIFTC